MKKRFFSMFLILALLLALVPAIAPKAEAATDIYWPVPGFTNLTRGYTSGKHEGIDIKSNANKSINKATIIAAISGKVTRVTKCESNHKGYYDCKCCAGEECYGTGTGVVIKGDDGRFYSYAHMTAGSIPANIKKGTRVQAGQVIGQVGNTGNSYGAHLHFSIAKGKNYWDKKIDPMKESFIYAKDVVYVQYASISTKYVDAGVQITLASKTDGATIKYTTNGKDPYTNGTTYKGPFVISAGCTIKTVAVKDGKVSPEFSKKVTLNKSTTPTISIQTAADGFSVTIKAEDQANIYYTLDGTNPTTSSARYQGPLTIKENATIKAMAVKSGKTASTVATAACSAQIPAVPKVTLDSSCSATMGVGGNIRISWPAVANTYQYEYTVLRDDQEVYSGTTQSTLATYTPTESGVYQLSVKAVNFLGSSEASAPPVTVTIAPDVTVSFVDYDGTVIEKQTIHYGADAIAPAAPSRVGHTFTKWSGTYVSVKQDTTVRATYVADTYTIKFLDREGNLLASELVEYGQPATNVPEAPTRIGYTFTGWSVKSGEGNSYTSANGNVVFEPTYTWSNPDLPLGVSLTKALRNADSTGYSLEIQVINSADVSVNGKLISVIKTSTDKVVATKIDNISIPAGATDYCQTVSLGGTALGSVAEVYIVANDAENDNRTGGIYAPMAKADVKMESAATVTYWSEWSEWSDVLVEASETVEVETKEQYAYRDMETTTSTNSAMAGWTQSGSTVTYGAWGSWSAWTTTKHTASTTKEVKSQKVYVYKHYCNGSGGIAPSTSYSNGKYGPHTLLFTSKQTHDRYSSSTGYYIADGLKKCEKGNGSYYYFGTATGYQYRTRTATTNYNYYRWTDLSDWSDSAYTSSDTRQVESRTIYRYRTLMTVSSTEQTNIMGTEDTSGTAYSVSGVLSNVAQDYTGKTAVVMIYKDKNIDPTEDQMEYIGQITIGEGNSYSLTFTPKEAISEKTGNYIVSFGIATADGLINNVQIIEAPKPSYNVVFRDTAGNILDSQTVTQGSDAVAPELPAVAGHDVTWNRSFTNVQADMVIRAVATPKTYNLIFVDWANDEIVAIKEVTYGQKIEFPADRTAEGKIFIGWSVPADSVVTETAVIEAQYEDIIFNVNFLNLDGSVFATQQVPYGEYATLPDETPAAEGFVFVAWSTENAWYNVKADMAIKPIFIYAETAENPTLISWMGDEPCVDSALVELEASTEDATVYYTLDGTEPTEDSAVYTEPFEIKKTTTLRTLTVKSGMNQSDTAEYTVVVHDSKALPTIAVSEDDKEYSVGLDTATIPVTIQNPNGYTLTGIYYRLDTLVKTVYAVGAAALTESVSDENIRHVLYIDGLAQDTLYAGTIYAEFAEVGAITYEIAIQTSSDHTHAYTDEKIAGTCVDEGYTRHTCHCGKTYEDSYTTLGDHTYENGACIHCEEVDPNYANLIKWAGSNVTLGGALSMNFAFDISQLNGTTGNYIVLTRSYADGKEDDVVTIPQSEWIPAGGSFVQVSYTNMAAKEMGDKITAVIYNAAGQVISQTRTDSMAEYSTRMLVRSDIVASAEKRTLFVDMLNYGAAAQVYFGYDAENLVNATLTAEQAGWASAAVQIANYRQIGGCYVGSNLSLEEEIYLQVAFNAVCEEGMYAVVSFTDHYGKPVEKTVAVEASGSYSIVRIEGMAIADYRGLVTCTLYSAEGAELGSTIDSIESYAARMVSALQKNGVDLGDAIMKLGASSYEFFH